MSSEDDFFFANSAAEKHKKNLDKYTGSAIAEEFEETESFDTNEGVAGKPT